MKKFWLTHVKIILLVSLWFIFLSVIARIRIDNAGVDAQFPYYNTLLRYLSRYQSVWAYFDGTHYLHLAQFGYDSTGPQAFFPVYPALIRFVHNFVGLSYYLSAVGISLISLTASLFICLKLFEKKWPFVVLSILLFPVSFYFGSVYTESIFLFLSLLFFLLLSQRKFWLASLVAGIASGTRLVGVFLSLALIYESYLYIRSQYRRFSKELLLKFILISLLSVSGLLYYMYFLHIHFRDPLMFLHVQSLFGSERSSDRLILLPQVLYRYARMIMTVDKSSFLYQRILLELFIFCGAVWAWFINLRRLPRSWSLYIVSSLLLPTLTGNLSSMPRYVMVLAPLLISPFALNKKTAVFLGLSFLLLIYLFWIYAGGAFVA